MTIHEPYMQRSFQHSYNKGAAGDHTHKFSKLIKATRRSGNIFTVSYTTMSLLGKITTSHLTFTKANTEIEPIIKGIKEIRSQNKTGDLL